VRYMSNTHRSLAGKTAVFDSSAPKSDEPHGVESGHKSRDGSGRDLLYTGLMAKGWTFQSLIDARMEVTEFCHHAPCNHSQKLDVVKLRDRFGPDAPAMEWDIRPKLRCAKCGGKKVGLIYTPDTTPNAYGKAKGSYSTTSRSGLLRVGGRYFSTSHTLSILTVTSAPRLIVTLSSSRRVTSPVSSICCPRFNFE
jgi:hypothetical protein